jgi:uncharacterized protein (TIGR02265 family)
MQERLVYEHTMEGLFVRGLAGRVTPGLKDRLRAVGLNLDRRLLPAYAFETWCSCVRLAAQLLLADLPEEEAYHQLGERMVDGFRETLMGRAQFSVLQLLGPQRVLHRAQQSFRSGNNYTEVRVHPLGPGEQEVWMNEPGFTRYVVQGALVAGLRASGAAEPQVRVEGFTEEDVTFRVSWKVGP